MLSLYRLIEIVGNALKAPDQDINIAPRVSIDRCPFTKDGYRSEDRKQRTKDVYKEERASKQLRNNISVNKANGTEAPRAGDSAKAHGTDAVHRSDITADHIENAILDADVEHGSVDRLQEKELPADNLGKRTYENFCETTASANG